MTKDDIIFVSSDLTPDFHQAWEHFRKLALVGIDFENIPCFTKFEPSGVALIQIATKEKCYLMDSLMM